jgi:predicted nucleic acid-binding protein
MTVAFVDSTVLVDLLRFYEPAVVWISQQPRLDVTSIAAMELLFGAQNKAAQRESIALLNDFDTTYLEQADLKWAYQQQLEYRLSHAVGVTDCLIASVSFRLQLPLYTHNLKHMQPLLGTTLAVRPY